jgi:hypothetical protein
MCVKQYCLYLSVIKRECVTEVPMNPIIWTRTHHFCHVYFNTLYKWPMLLVRQDIPPLRVITGWTESMRRSCNAVCHVIVIHLQPTRPDIAFYQYRYTFAPELQFDLQCCSGRGFNLIMGDKDWCDSSVTAIQTVQNFASLSLDITLPKWVIIHYITSVYSIKMYFLRHHILGMFKPHFICINLVSWTYYHVIEWL